MVKLWAQIDLAVDAPQNPNKQNKNQVFGRMTIKFVCKNVAVLIVMIPLGILSLCCIVALVVDWGSTAEGLSQQVWLESGQL